MGFLEIGSPYPWAESLGHLKYVRRHGVLQFISTYNRLKNRTNDVLQWGDEVRSCARGGGPRVADDKGRCAGSALRTWHHRSPSILPNRHQTVSRRPYPSSPAAPAPVLPRVFRPPRQIEYHLVEIPSAGTADVRAPRLALIAPEILEQLNAEDAALPSAR